jgi:hypothetical protein
MLDDPRWDVMRPRTVVIEPHAEVDPRKQGLKLQHASN